MEELGGRIVCDFTDQETGRRDDRVGWSELIREAKEPEARRFDAVIVYSTSRLSRELFHALAYERELARAGVEVFYARSAGDQTSPEDWVEAEQRHEALVSEEDFERVQAEMKARSAGQGGNRRRYKQKRFYRRDHPRRCSCRDCDLRRTQAGALWGGTSR